VRRVKTVRGEVTFCMTCAPKFDYGRSNHKIEKTKDGILFINEGNHPLRLLLRAAVPLEINDGEGVCEFKLSAGQTAQFILEEVVGGEESPAKNSHYVAESFKRTSNYWRDWVSKSHYKGRWREMINRSALTLKLLTFEPTGAIVASPTFGLPEELGGERNWDYRYTWIRDASFTLYGLIRLGYTDEAKKFMQWIEKRCQELAGTDCSALQIMYGIDGRHKLGESTLEHFEGYRKSSPVRIGNGAYDQLQLDIYGELMDAVYLYDKYGEPISYDLWQNLIRLVDWVCHNWHRKDEGIWEVRGGQQEFLYSRLMCWVALDRGIRLALKRSYPAPLDKWYKMRDKIYNEIFTTFWNEEGKYFVQHNGSKTLDAANLLMPLVRFISPTDPRWLSTLDAIEKELVDDSLVFRYKTKTGASDGLSGEEGTFCMCSFWNVECISRSGDLPQARFLLEKMFGYANHLGLYAEELGPCGEHLGNFPQAFTHLALISAAYDLNRRLGE
ncbi:MAG: glycoside hydrolase family 15 protein, partial [Candidatus Omnitrophica bacterium]|nr:glycoside hydrolase family 15 protein [Candidatus Omnitrophota bacterium]